MTRLPLRNDVPFCTAEQAAIHLLCIARDRNTPINHRQLQNLLYYAQGYSLSLGESLLFEEVIEVSKHGPVVPIVEHAYECHGDNSIPVPTEMNPERRAVMPGVLLGQVFTDLMVEDAASFTSRLKSEWPWRDACANGGVVDPRGIATWWCERFDAQRAKRKPQPRIKLSEYLKQRPDIRERLSRRYEPHELIPWR